MTRSLNAATSSAVEAEAVSVGLFLQTDFSGGSVYVWNGVGTVTSGGNDYLGTGQMGQVSGVAEDGALQDVEITVALSHIAEGDLPDLVTELRDNNPKGTPFTLSLGTFDASMNLNAPEPLTSGWIDDVSWSYGEEGAVTLKLATYARLFDRSKSFSLSCAHQQKLFSGDTALCKKKKDGNTIKFGNRVIGYDANRFGQAADPILR